LDQLEEFAETDLRVVIQVADDKSARRLLLLLREQGYAAHPERSAFSDMEIVVTRKVQDGDRSEKSTKI